VNVRKLMFVGLAVVIALGSLFVVACGEEESTGPDPKVAMADALAVIDADIVALTDEMMAGGTGADVKAAKDSVASDWEAVVDACEGLDGADAAKAQKVFDDLAAAIDGLADDADLATIAGVVMGPLTELTDYAAELGELVGYEGPAEDTAAGE